MPAPSEFLAGVLAAPSAKYEPIRNNNALLRLTTTTIGLPGFDELTLALAGFSLPKNETNPIQVPFLNETRKFPGQTSFDDMNVSFHDYVEAGVARFLWQWRFKVHNPKTGRRQLKYQLAANGSIEHFDPDGGNVRRYIVEGCWPMSIDMGDAEMGADDAMRIQVRFCCDKIYPDTDSGSLFATGVDL